MQTVNVGATIYHNAVVTVTSFVSCEGVSGADSYSGGVLSISLVQVGPTTYRGMRVSLGGVVSVGGGMPTFVPDTYSAPNNQLAIPAVQVGNRVVTNVIITVGDLLGVSGVSSTFQVSSLYSFGSSGNNDGGNPQAGLIEGSNGLLFGTTTGGGTNLNGGTVYTISTSGTESVLYAFCQVGGAQCTDGELPVAGLIQSGANFYGTTEIGGAYGTGTVFQVTPGGIETALYSFNQSQMCTDGYAPRSALLQAQDGNLYGVTNAGGISDPGTIFKITPDRIETVLYSFGGGGTNAIYPQAPLFQHSTGVFYGTIYEGGSAADGTAFRMALTD